MDVVAQNIGGEYSAEILQALQDINSQDAEILQRLNDIYEQQTEIRDFQEQQLLEVQQIKEIELNTYTYTVYLFVAVLSFSVIRLLVSHFNSVIG